MSCQATHSTMEQERSKKKTMLASAGISLLSQPPYLLVFLLSVCDRAFISQQRMARYNTFQRKSALDNLFLFSINPGIFFLTPQQPTATNISSLSASLSSNFRSNFLHTYCRIFLWLSTIFVHPSLLSREFLFLFLSPFFSSAINYFQIPWLVIEEVCCSTSTINCSGRFTANVVRQVHENSHYKI